MEKMEDTRYFTADFLQHQRALRGTRSGRIFFEMQRAQTHFESFLWIILLQRSCNEVTEKRMGFTR